MRLLNTENTRTALICKNVIVSFLLKFFAALIMILLVPLTLRCLGEYQNGVWLTVSSILVWIDQMDIGLGNGLRNKLAVNMAHDNQQEARSMVSSAMAMLVCTIIPVGALLLLLTEVTDVYAFFNADIARIPELRASLQAGVILVCMTFVLKIIGNVYMGMQMPAMSNLIIVSGQMFALLSTWLLLKTGHATFFYIVIANTASPLMAYILFYPVTFYKMFPFLRPTFSLINMRTAISLGNLGVRFFWLQTAAIIQMMTANILISNFFTPEMVTPYQITFRYFSLPLVAFNVICMPFWNATTDAYERHDMLWIRNADRRMQILVLLMALIIVLMVAVSPFVYQLWIGDMCDVPLGMTVMMAAYTLIIIASSRYSYFLNGIGALRLQMYMTVTVVLFIPLSWLASELTHDINYFMAVMCVCIAPSWIVNKIQFNKILNGRATGIWRI